MSQEQLPIRVHPVLDLQSLGLNPSSFRFGSLTLESEKFICIIDELQDGSAQIIIIELQNNNKVFRYPIKTEAAIMNPIHSIIALKSKNEDSGGHFVQIYNLDTKINIRVYNFPEEIVYWRWLTASKLACVTTKTIYHWSLDEEETPVRIFDRSGPLEGYVQIINYSTDQSETWCLLTAISTPDEEKTMDGYMQIYFTNGQQQQILEGHAGCFGEIPLKDGPAVTCFSFSEKKVNETISRVHVLEINRPASERKFLATMEFSYPPEAPNDFPVTMHLLSKYGVIAMITKFGYLYLFETIGANLIYRTRFCENNFFVTCEGSRHDSVFGVNKRGQVLGIFIEEASLVPFIMNTCRHIPDAATIGFTLVQRFKLACCEDLFVQQFERLMAQGDIKGAAKIAAAAPGNLLRNQETTSRLRALPQALGQPHPMLTYFSTLLELGKLNKYEALIIARPLLEQGRKYIIQTWIERDKIEYSEELGDLVAEFDLYVALEIYERVGCAQKVIDLLIETGQYNKFRTYTKNNNIAPNYVPTIMQVIMVLQAATSYLLEVLNGNFPEQAHLQTKLLEMNIIQAPQVAETIFQTNTFFNYDKIRIAQLCEKAGLAQRALENYSNISDIRRVLENSVGISQDFLVEFFGHMTPNNALQCMYGMMKSNRAANFQVVVLTAIKYHAEITIPALIQMFESFGSYDGIFFFLGSVLNFTEEPDIYFKYIEAAAKLNQSLEVERVIRETRFYDPVKVKDFLKEIKLPDPRPLIYLCDIYGFFEEFTRYIYRNYVDKYIEVYLIKLNPMAAPIVLGTLIDIGADESFIRKILCALRASCPSQPLIEEMEKRERLRIIQPWLEDREREGNQEVAIHTALAKIYIDTNMDPEDFLTRNQFYDSKIVGKYCEERNADLAVKAYTRACGECDDELIDLTNKNSMYRDQAKYLVERKSLELWAKVLSAENQHRRSVIEHAIASTLPESKDAEEVCIAIKSFFEAELQKELMELLEKIVIHKSEFSKNKILQNLLLVTAIKVEPSRFAGYINRLDNYDAPEVAQYALSEHGLAEEAFLIYKNAEMNEKAIEVLLTHIGHLERASEFAERVATPEVWSRLGRAQLDADLVDDAIESYIKAEDASSYQLVIKAAERNQSFARLIKYLMLARSQNLNQKDSLIDAELLLAFAKCDMLNEIEEFIANSNQVDINTVGDRCYNEKLYEAANILFASINNYTKLARCLVKLKRYVDAIEAAKSAKNSKVWKEVNFACVANKEFKLAMISGLNIINHPDHLEDIIRHYEHYGYPNELISLLEGGMASERAYQGIFTELGILYAKYRPKKLMEHCKNYYPRLNIPKLLRACERFRKWPEAVFLYIKYDEFDNALATMIDHSPKAWSHEIFTDVIQKASSQDLLFRAMIFYLEEQPMLINDLLRNLSAKIDHAKAVQVLRRAGHLALCLPWLQSIQIYNISQVNEAVNELLIEQEDYEALKRSVSSFDSFDQLGLAKSLELHSLLEMRRISAYIYRTSQRYSQSLAISKADQVFGDTMETIQESKSSELTEELLKYFIEIRKKEAFYACAYVCYSFIPSDIVIELSERAGYCDLEMTYFMQAMKDISTRGILNMEKKTQVKEKNEEAKAEVEIGLPLEVIDSISTSIGGLGSAPVIMVPNMPLTMMGGGEFIDPGIMMSQPRTYS